MMQPVVVTTCYSRSLLWWFLWGAACFVVSAVVPPVSVLSIVVHPVMAACCGLACSGTTCFVLLEMVQSVVVQPS